MSLLGNVVMTYFVINLICAFYEAIRYVKEVRAKSIKDIDELVRINRPEKFNYKIAYEVAYWINVTTGLIVGVFAWMPLKMVMLLKGRTL